MAKVLIRVAVSVALIGLLVYFMRDHAHDIASALTQADLRCIAAGVAVFCMALTIMAVRLKLIFNVQEIRMSLKDALHLTFIGLFFNNFLPTAVGGDVVKAYCAARATGEKMKSVASVLMDRIFGLFMFILVPSLTIVFLLNRLDPIVPKITFGVLAAAILGFFMIFNKNWAKKLGFLLIPLEKLKLKDKVVLLYEGLHSFKHHSRAIPAILGLSVAAQILSIMSVYFFILALGAEPDFLALFLLTPIVFLMSMIPVSIGGLGLREGGFVIFFQRMIGEHNAWALGILYMVQVFFVSLIGGAIYMVRHDYHFRMKELPAA